MDAKNVAHIVAGMVTTNQNSTTRVHRLEGSAEEAVAETAAAAAALWLAAPLARARARVRGSPLVGLEDDWDRPEMLKAYLVEAATGEFVAESAAERIDHSRYIGCRAVPF